MTTALLAALVGALAANPLPDNRAPIDSLTYTFGGGGLLRAGGSLTITKDGKASYFYSSAPHTGSGGDVAQKSWELSKEERTELFRKLVADGLLDAEEGPGFFDAIHVAHGRWRASFAADKVPDKVMAHLRPLLSKADPVKWPDKKPVVIKDAPAKPGTLNYLHYHFSTKADGDHVTLIVSRDGKVRYVRQPPTEKRIEAEWTVPAKDAEALLDALAADGLFDLNDVGRDKFARYMIDAQVGRWRTTFHLNEFPEKLSKQLLPLLKRADVEFWK